MKRNFVDAMSCWKDDDRDFPSTFQTSSSRQQYYVMLTPPKDFNEPMHAARLDQTKAACIWVVGFEAAHAQSSVSTNRPLHLKQPNGSQMGRSGIYFCSGDSQLWAGFAQWHDVSQLSWSLCCRSASAGYLPLTKRIGIRQVHLSPTHTRFFTS